jgi:hypothetical protein
VKVDRVLGTLSQGGLLLVADQSLPSVATMVAGTPIRGSWWGHPAGKQIYEVLGALHEHPDVVCVKLIKGKDTLVHRSLFGSLRGVGTSRADWQMMGLSAAARALLADVDVRGIVTNEPSSTKEDRDLARLIEQRLLALGGSRHTESGRHERFLESWARWSAEAGAPKAVSDPAAREELERAALALGATADALPWNAPLRGSRRARSAPR